MRRPESSSGRSTAHAAPLRTARRSWCPRRSGPYAAIRPGGRGDISKTHVVWHVPTGAPYISSVVHYEGLIYMAGDVGVVTCVDAKTGERVWGERLGGIYTASPIAGDGRIYLFGESGETIVLK